MGLRDIATAAQTADPTIDEVKAHIEAEVALAADEGYGIVEVEVPYSQHVELQAWVQSEGMRCGCTVAPGRAATLVINTTLAPPVPKTAEQIQAEIEAALARTIETNALLDRVTALEAELAALKGGV